MTIASDAPSGAPAVESLAVGGASCRLWCDRHFWWWRCEHWPAAWPDIGPYLARDEAVREARKHVALHPELRGGSRA